MSTETAPAIGVIGGSGLYELEGFTDAEEVRMMTPWGEPSDAIITGSFSGRRVCFLARHARGHRLLPTEVNHRANIFALRALGVRWLVCVTAVGSLREQYAPRSIVLPDQFLDRSSRRAQSTFFGDGIVAHVGFSDPVSAGLRGLLHGVCLQQERPVHNGGTYVMMDGPAFSTRAESHAHRMLGGDIIGMTNLPEAKLAREAEIACATLCMVTDYDCWKTDEAPVTVETVIGHLLANATTAKEILAAVIPRIPSVADWPEHRSLDMAIVTDRQLWPVETMEKLRPILGARV